MSIICGADGCRGGWIAVSKELDSGHISWRRCSTAQELVYGEPIPALIAIDIPIGLTDAGPRVCDIEARRILGPGRAGSVFPAPIRPVLAVASYAQACQIMFGVEGKKLSKQSWGIIPKIREVDNLFQRDARLSTRVREVHPEVSFYFLAGGRPMKYSKKYKEGLEERRELLESAFGTSVRDCLLDRHRLGGAADDILDAFVALWTAERIIKAESRTFPLIPPVDGLGLRMEILA